MNKIDLELRSRFVKDFNLPVQVLISPYFEYFLDLYQEDYESKSKWRKLQKEISEKFSGNTAKYLDDYYKTRNQIITDLESSKAYTDFCEDPDFFNKFSVPGEIKGDLYTETQVGKKFLSIDLVKANFQALRFYNPKLVKDTKTYEEFIGIYDNSPIFSESKYTRQVIFGKLNAKRQTTIEKWLVWKISEYLKNILPEEFKLFSRQTDEIIYELQGNYEYTEMGIKEKIKENLDLDVSVKIFCTDWIQRFTKEGSSITGFIKNYIYPVSKKSTLHKVQGTYFAQMYKMWKGMDINPVYDLVLLHEKQLAHFDYQLLIINPNDKNS